MGKREDIFGQLHPVVAGVECAGDASCCRVDRQEVPPLKCLTVADVVCRSLIVFMLYQYHLVAVTHRVGTYAEGIVLDAKRWFISVAYQLYHPNRSHTLSLRNEDIYSLYSAGQG